MPSCVGQSPDMAVSGDALCTFVIPYRQARRKDLNALGPRLQLDLLRDWPKLALDRELWREVASRC